MKADLRRLRDKVAAIEERTCNYGVSRLKSRRRDPIDLPLLLMFLLSRLGGDAPRGPRWAAAPAF